MGKQEKELRKRRRRNNLQKVLLRTVATAGFVAFAVAAPNTIQALVKLGIIDIKKGYKETGVINRARNRLIEARMLSKDGKGFLRLTAKGERRLRQLELADYKLKKPKRWDGKWRMLIFDIPEYRKSLREKVRRTLVAIGFVRLQDSVWMFPYPCDDFIALLKVDFKIGKDLLYLIVDSIENDAVLRKRFSIT